MIYAEIEMKGEESSIWAARCPLCGERHQVEMSLAPDTVSRVFECNCKVTHSHNAAGDPVDIMYSFVAENPNNVDEFRCPRKKHRVETLLAPSQWAERRKRGCLKCAHYVQTCKDMCGAVNQRVSVLKSCPEILW